MQLLPVPGEAFPENIWVRVESELTDIVRKKSRGASLFITLSDWFYGISLVVAILTPFGIASMIYLPGAQQNFGPILLWVSGIATALALIRSVFRLQERGKHLARELVATELLLNKVRFRQIGKEEYEEEFKQLGLLSVEEPGPS